MISALQEFYGWPVRPVAASLVFIASWMLAASLRWFLRKAGRTDWVARLLTRSGLLAGLVEPSLDQVRFAAGRTVYWLVILAGFGGAVSILSDFAAARLMELILVYLPKALLAVLLLSAFRWLAGYWSRWALVSASNEGLAYPWRWAAVVHAGTLFAGIAMVSELTGIATALIRSAFLIVLAGVVVLCVLTLAPILQANRANHDHKPIRRFDETCR